MTISEIPRIISADDHVTEPPDMWTNRLPEQLRDIGPRVVRRKTNVVYPNGKPSAVASTDDTGVWCDWWLYESVEMPFILPSASAGMTSVDFTPITYDDIRPGCWKVAERLQDMDVNHVDASVCFPNVVPRFCGQTFLEAQDKDLALLCVKAYNDWMIEEWCGGDAHGRLIPLTLVPLWDAEAAAAEVLRCAALGSYAIAFTESPHALGMPSMHSGYWEPLFAACNETETIINLHIGSSSKAPITSPDAPHAITSTLWFQNAAGAMADYLVSGVFERYSNLKIALSEAQVGWMPYVLERLDKIWEGRDHESSMGLKLAKPPSAYARDHVFGCIYDDESGLNARDVIGMDQIMFEVDYPHQDGTFPHTKDVATRICDKAGLNDEERYKLMRGNAINAFGLQRFGITS
jgi:predicted TIM-barrel fold metal-dependent hydrolase